MVPNMRLKIKNSKKWTPPIFCLHLYSNLAKFQLHSSITAKVDSKNVFLRYRDFKLQDLFFIKIDLFWPNISQNPKNLLAFRVFMVQYLEIHEKTSPNMVKSHFGWTYSWFWLILSIIFILEIHGKGRFSPYPSELERKYLENGARYWHFVKSVEFLKNPLSYKPYLYFWPWTPLSP